MQIVVDNEGYLYYKYINTIVFTDNYDEVFDDFVCKFGQPRLLSIVMLNAIVLTLGNIIDDEMERNILTFTDYIKESLKNSKDLFEDSNITLDECFEYCNEIISYVNGHKLKGDALSYYCAEQLQLRGYGALDRLTLTSGSKLLSTFKRLKGLQVQDFAVLAALYADKSGELFNQKKNDYCNPNFLYITCIISLIQENPNLLDDDRFLLRTKYVLDNYKNNINNCRLDKAVKKKMLVKNYKTLEKELMKSTIK